MSAAMTNKTQQSQSLSLNFMIEEETVLTQMQGIVTILGCDTDINTASAPSLRRTLSADMSSKKWLSQNGSSSPMKKVASSEQLLHPKTIADSSSSSEGEDDYEENKEQLEAEAERERLEIWSSIQRNKKEEQEKGGPFDTWSSIISLKPKDEISKSLPVTPYIHPLVKRYNYVASANKKSPPRSFPPPLPSLSRQTGPSLHMRPRRDNGRLVLEAVSLPSMNNFCVQRQDGRLVLTFANQNDETKEDAEKEEEKENDHVEGELGGFEEDDIDQEEKEDEAEEEEVVESESDVRDVETVIEKAPLLSSGIASLALMVNKPIGLVNRNTKWSEKFNEVANLDEDVKVVEPNQMAQSLPPRPRVARLISSKQASAAAASFNFNAYEHYWRTKPTAKAANPLGHHQQNNNNSPLKNNSNNKLIVSGDKNRASNEQQQLLVLRGKNGDYLVHHLKSCKDSRRSLLFWEPYCIATS
ncbi:The fantastic four family [Sesbania bispinosa]|nr:The fantastic four family [Sesbania bispinosa]